MKSWRLAWARLSGAAQAGDAQLVRACRTQLWQAVEPEFTPALRQLPGVRVRARCAQDLSVLWREPTNHYCVGHLCMRARTPTSRASSSSSYTLRTRGDHNTAHRPAAAGSPGSSSAAVTALLVGARTCRVCGLQCMRRGAARWCTRGPHRRRAGAAATCRPTGSRSGQRFLQAVLCSRDGSWPKSEPEVHVCAPAHMHGPKRIQ